MLHTILRLPAVLGQRGKSRSAHYLDIQHGLYTKPIKIGARASGWTQNEVEVQNAARIAGKTDDVLFGGTLASTLEELKAQTAALYFT